MDLYLIKLTECKVFKKGRAKVMTARNHTIFTLYIESLMLRNGCGNSIKEFADKAGIGERTIYHWLEKRCLPNVQSIKKLQKVGADVEYIYELMGGDKQWLKLWEY